MLKTNKLALLLNNLHELIFVFSRSSAKQVKLSPYKVDMTDFLSINCSSVAPVLVSTTSKIGWLFTC